MGRSRIVEVTIIQALVLSSATENKSKNGPQKINCSLKDKAFFYRDYVNKLPTHVFWGSGVLFAGLSPGRIR